MHLELENGQGEAAQPLPTGFISVYVQSLPATPWSEESGAFFSLRCPQERENIAVSVPYPIGLTPLISNLNSSTGLPGPPSNAHGR